MRKVKWKRAVASVLVLAMTMGLAACNKAGKESDPQKQKGDNKNAALAKECVYAWKDVDLGMDEEDGNSVIATAIFDEQVYFLFNQYRWDENYRNQENNLILVQVDKEGALVKKTTMENPAPIQKEEGEDSGEDITVPEKPEDGDDDGEIILFEDPYIGQMESYENSYYGNCTIQSDKVLAIRNYYSSKYVDNDYVSEDRSFIVCWKTDGTLQWEREMDLSEYQNEDTWSAIQNLVAFEDGTVGIVMTGDKSGMIIVGEDGSLSPLKKAASKDNLFDRQDYMCIRQDGIIVFTYSNEDWSERFINTYDPVKGEYGTEYKIPKSATSQGFYEFNCSGEDEIIFSNYNGVFKFRMGDEDIVKVLDYINSDLSVNSLQRITSVDQEHFFAWYYDSIDWREHLAYFSYVKPEDVQDKQVIVLAGMWLDSEVREEVIKFNKNNQQYRITAKDYSKYSTDDDYMAGYTKMNNDILAGEIPDIFLLDQSMPVSSYISKGLLQNIDELIKNDPELSQVEFMENVFDAYRVDGKLYRVIPRFIIYTAIGKKSFIGDRSSWTMDEARQVLAKMPEGAQLIGDVSREDLVSYMMYFSGADYIDEKTGKCYFDTDQFVSLLEFSKTLPTREEMEAGYDYEDSSAWEEYWLKRQMQYREDRTLLMNIDLSDPRDIKRNVNGYFGEEVVYVGFPATEGNGSSINPTASYALYAKSSVKDGAWDFLRRFLSDDYQKVEEDEENSYNNYQWGFPVTKKYVKQLVDQTTKNPYWINEDGEKIEEPDQFYIGEDTIEIKPFTQQQADELMNFICSVNKPSFYNQDVEKILSEETEAFYSGAKSAKEVASTIQNRVQLYMNENR